MESARTDPDTGGKAEGPPRPSPDAEARRLEEKANALRENVDELVSELDRRRHRAIRTYLRPTLIGVAIAGVAALATLAVLAWRSAGRRSSRTARKTGKKMARVGLALRRAAAHPERVAADPAPSVGKHAATAAISLASLIAGRLIKRHLKA
jgi:hypothetical protein